MEDSQLNIEALAMFQNSPFEFIEASLGETPQPIKEEYREYVLKLYVVPAHEFSAYAATIHKGMFEEFEKGKHLTWQQSIFVIAVQRAVNGSLPPRIAVKAGRGTGKSNIMSKLILWYLFSFPLSRIPCTAPTSDQLFAVLWSEINLTLSNMKPEYADMFEWSSDFVRIKQRPKVWYARAKTAGKGQTGALSGIHCFEDGTAQVMTQNGFKDFKDIALTDYVMTRKGWQKPSEIIRKKYTGEMVYQEGQLFSFSVTPEHKFPSVIRNSHYLRDNKPQWSDEQLVTVQDWGQKVVKVPRYIETDYGTNKDTYVIPEYKNYYQSQPLKKAIEVPMDAWVAFLGWYLAEGSIGKTNVGIAQSLKNQAKRDEIAEVITRLGFTPSAVGKNAIYLCNTQVLDHIKKICPGKAATKKVPNFIFGLSQRQINIFLDAYQKGDGCVEKNGRVSYVTSSKQMANDLQRLILLAGRYATISTAAKKGSLMNVKGIYGTRNHDVYCVREWSNNRNLHAVSKGTQRKVKKYKGIAECLTVPSGMFYVRDKKSSQGFWTGNSDFMASFADESYDIEDDVFQVAEATQTGDKSLMILVGNAVHDHGYFYDCFNKNADSWITLTMNAEESPIVNQGLIADQKRTYGENSNHYRASILGEFPIATAIDVDGWRRLFSDSWIEDVMKTEDDLAYQHLFSDSHFRKGRSYLGVDPSGEGSDESVGYIRNESAAKLVFHNDQSSVRSCALSTIGTIETFGLDGQDVVCDNFGVGAELSQEVMIQSNSSHVIEGKNVGDRCEDILDQATYQNERARMYDALYWWGKRGGKILYDETLVNELKTIFVRETEQGKKQIMPKREMRKRGFPSPNRSDALCLTTINDRMISNYIPRADFRAVQIKKLTDRHDQKAPEQFDRNNSIPSI